MSNIRPRIALLMLGSAPAQIKQDYGDFDQWFTDCIGDRVEVDLIRCYDGVKFPSISESDGWIMTGSPASVNDDIKWLSDAKISLDRANAVGHPILGVCFGHQLLAEALGGAVQTNPLGWELGLTKISVSTKESKLFTGLTDPISVFETHQDIVHKLPSGAILLAENEMGIQAFQSGDNSFGVQFHPEFTAPIARAYSVLHSDGAPVEAVDLFNQGEESRQILSNFIRHYF